MLNKSWPTMVAVAITTLTAACAPAAPASRPESSAPGQAATAPSRPSRTLVVGARYEPVSLASRSPREGNVNVYIPKAMFNADLALLDENGNGRPYLAETFPQLNTDTWRVFPDGRMETTYTLKPNLTWHDGAPLTARDWEMTWQAFSVPGLGLRGVPPFSLIEGVSANDDRTFVISWKQLYADALLTTYNRELSPLPSHILGPALQADQGENFANDAFWTREFVGAGPYKLDRWEIGSFLEATPFDAHVLGRAKIDRVRLNFISDQSAAMASLLAGEMHLSDGSSIGAVEALLFNKEWEAGQKGSIILVANQWRGVHFQQRPDISTPPALADQRVRKALAHALDKVSFNNALYEGHGIIADSMISPRSSYGDVVDRTIIKYPYDPQRTSQLMAEAGYAKGTDGVFTSPTAGRFSSDSKTNTGRDNELERDILMGLWKQEGFEFQGSVVPTALATDGETRSTFPGVFTTSSTLGEGALSGIVTSNIATPANGWRGNNRGGWSSPAYDRLVAELNNTLDATQRGQIIAQAVRVYSDELPVITMFFRPLPFVYVAGLRLPMGVQLEDGGTEPQIHADGRRFSQRRICVNLRSSAVPVTLPFWGSNGGAGTG
ncbi:MAG: hypothetical protein HW416_3714 [Chloroflexi bacterium]|nr:hypothetical protein [Chloroflexota bacterium]